MNPIFERDTNFTSSRCKLLEEPNYVNLALSIFILLGILVSYLPQHHRIIVRGTSEGISPFFILLGETSGTFSLANVLTLPASRADISCCKVVSIFKCAAGLLGILQVVAQWICFSVILFLFLAFFPRDLERLEIHNNDTYTWRTALQVMYICLLHAFVVLLVSSILHIFRPTYLGAWANSLGIMAATLAVIQYLPQIWTTWSLGDVRSLSIPMMLIQTPGSFIWSGSLALRLGVDGWSTWGLFLLTGCLQGTLLVMGIYFELRRRKITKMSGNNTLQRSLPEIDEDDDAVTPKTLESHESRPLLSDE